MSTIHVETLIEAMGQERLTLGELADKTGYPFPRLLLYLLEARSSGYLIAGVPGKVAGDPTTFVNLGKEQA